MYRKEEGKKKEKMEGWKEKGLARKFSLEGTLF